MIEQGAQYSGRRHTYLTNAISGGISISMADDDKNWREQRKLIAHYLSPKQLDENHYKVQEAEYVLHDMFAERCVLIRTSAERRF
jgi:cytochrome P450